MQNPYLCLSLHQKISIPRRTPCGKALTRTTPRLFSSSKPIPDTTAAMVTGAVTISGHCGLTRVRTTVAEMALQPRAVSRRSISEKQARRVGSELAASAVCLVPVIVLGLDRARTVLYRPVAAHQVHPRPPHLAQALRHALAQVHHLAATSTGRRPRHMSATDTSLQPMHPLWTLIQFQCWYK